MDGTALAPAIPETLVVDVDGFEGPLDLLLTLARSQKVDLREISILALARQYLAFMERAARHRIELAADYLVMAAWLAYLKSRLLLPEEPSEEPPAEDLARDLALRLARLEAMRDAARQLLDRPRLGRDRLARGQPETAEDTRRTEFTASLHDLLSAYARLRTRDDFRPFAFDRVGVYTMEQALDRLRPLIGDWADWNDLRDWLPPGWAESGSRRRAATAATFAAALELVREGLAEIRQDADFAPIHLRARSAP
ncbi:segregation and condensation protein A [Rubellimicrobium aerolatum]|uniref:Segregation and condensation protein A n=1 Tax=Rubellimicrobium aerolatum TaxID=490979 RepID=A0ABW0SB79_9RHOB|nr:ScpA family protein [Rubellimicrobium aerolatum]MBP1805453.1 segregation and condensation protein A [Rubellimicrobium aerolatum]